MDKFLKTSQKESDLLQLLQNRNQKKRKLDESSLSEVNSKCDDKDVWNDNSLTEMDIVLSEKNAKIKSRGTLTGWKIENGKKVYKTFRKDGLVSAEGGEAFKLSLGDQKSSKKIAESKKVQTMRWFQKDNVKK